MQSEIRLLTTDEREHLAAVAEELLPLDLPNPEELPRGLDLVGNMAGWLLGLTFLSMLPFVGLFVLIDRLFQPTGKASEWIGLSCMAATGCVALTLSIRVLLRHLRRAKQVDAYRAGLAEVLKGPVAVERLTVRAAHRVTRTEDAESRKDHSVILDVGEGRRLFVRDPSRYGLEPVPCMDEIEGDLQRLNLEPQAQSFPRAECLIFRAHAGGECLGLMTVGDPVPPQRMIAEGMEIKDLPADVGLIQPGASLSEEEQKKRTVQDDNLTLRKRIARLLLSIVGLVLVVFLIGFFTTPWGKMRIADVKAKMGTMMDGDSISIRGTIKSLPRGTSDITYDGVALRTMVLEDETGTITIHYLMRDYPGGFSEGEKVQVDADYEEAKLGLNSTAILRATKISVR